MSILVVELVFWQLVDWIVQRVIRQRIPAHSVMQGWVQRLMDGTVQVCYLVFVSYLDINTVKHGKHYDTANTTIKIKEITKYNN